MINFHKFIFPSNFCWISRTIIPSAHLVNSLRVVRPFLRQNGQLASGAHGSPKDALWVRAALSAVPFEDLHWPSTPIPVTFMSQITDLQTMAHVLEIVQTRLQFTLILSLTVFHLNVLCLFCYGLSPASSPWRYVSSSWRMFLFSAE